MALLTKLVAIQFEWGSQVELDEEDLKVLHEAHFIADKLYRPRPTGCINYEACELPEGESQHGNEEGSKEGNEASGEEASS